MRQSNPLRLVRAYGAALLSLLSPQLFGANYETGYPSISKISSDLYQALPPKSRAGLTPTPVLMENIAMPFVEPGEHREGTNLVRYVSISSGFIDFVNLPLAREGSR